MSFPGPGFTGLSSSMKLQQSTTGQTPVLLQQANVLTVTLVTPNPQGISIPAGNPAEAHAPGPAMGWVGGGEPLPTGNFGGGALKYTIKNEQGAEVLLVEAAGIGDLSMRTPEGSQILRLMSSPGVQAINFLLPSGESLGELVVETKVKKDKEGKDGKEKKHKEEKKSDKKDKEKDKPHKEHKDKDKDSPKRRYVLRNLGGQEIMTVSIKSKPKDMKFDMKIKSLQRKGEVCMIESVRGPAGNGYQIRFKSGSVTVPNEKLYATGAVIGIIDLENSHQAAGVNVGHPLM